MTTSRIEVPKPEVPGDGFKKDQGPSPGQDGV